MSNLCASCGLGLVPRAGVKRGETTIWVRPTPPELAEHPAASAGYTAWSVESAQLRLSASDLPRALTLAAIQLVIAGGQILVVDERGLLQRAVVLEAHSILPSAASVGASLSYQVELATRLHPLVHYPGSAVPSYDWGGWRARLSPYGDAVEVEIPLSGNDWFTSYLSQDETTGITYAYAALTSDVEAELAALVPVIVQLGPDAAAVLPTLTGLLTSGSQDALGVAGLQRHSISDALTVTWSDLEPAVLALDAHARLSIRSLDNVCANVFSEMLQLRAVLGGSSNSAAAISTQPDGVTSALGWIDENLGYVTRIIANLNALFF